eukprot:scaffold6271_cov171-Amphora_coffeaeformis.AAC.9
MEKPERGATPVVATVLLDFSAVAFEADAVLRRGGSFGMAALELFGAGGMEAKSGSVSGEEDCLTQDPLILVRCINWQRSARPRTKSSW